MKINIKQMALAGMMLALLTISKYLDHFLPKTPSGFSWIDSYMILTVIFVLVLPMPIAILILNAAPFMWFALGQMHPLSPLSFFLDYSLPLLSMLIIYLARFFKNKNFKYPVVILLIIIAFFLKWISHTISGIVIYSTPELKYTFATSGAINAPFTFATMALAILFIVPIMPRLNELQSLVNTKGISW